MATKGEEREKIAANHFSSLFRIQDHATGDKSTFSYMPNVTGELNDAKPLVEWQGES